ncbi:MAG: hypothetical protein HYS09_08420 [Chloroflexi bacterium]|nr:hypothetical protein [Chloroflexota bacterium]
MRFLIALGLGFAVGVLLVRVFAPERAGEARRRLESLWGEEEEAEEGAEEAATPRARLRRAVRALQEQLREAWQEAQEAAREAEGEMLTQYEESRRRAPARSRR